MTNSNYQEDLPCHADQPIFVNPAAAALYLDHLIGLVMDATLDLLTGDFVSAQSLLGACIGTEIFIGDTA